MKTMEDRLQAPDFAKPLSGDLAIRQLRARMKGSVVTATDAGYDAVRTRLSPGAASRPAFIARPLNADDVAKVVRAARETGMELAIRSGGHSLAGFSTSDGGIVLDLSAMKGLEIDPGERTAWAAAGLTAGEYTAATARFGLATGFGDTASVGLGGW